MMLPMLVFDEVCSTVLLRSQDQLTLCQLCMKCLTAFIYRLLGRYCQCWLIPADTGIESVQGEVVEQQFGEKEVCFRTLDLYTSAVLEASLNPTTGPKPEWRAAMDTMSQVRPSASPQPPVHPVWRPCWHLPSICRLLTCSHEHHAA